MLAVEWETRLAKLKLQAIWYIGSEFPVQYTDVAGVIEIQADGDELSRIEQLFPNLPLMPKGKRVVRFFGDTAKSIASALV